MAIQPFIIHQDTGTVEVENCTIINSTAEGGATFSAPLIDGNVNGGGNTGWVFGGIETPSIYESANATSSVVSNMDNISEQATISESFGSNIDEALNPAIPVQDEMGSLIDNTPGEDASISSSFYVALLGLVIDDSLGLGDESLYRFPKDLNDEFTLSDSGSASLAKALVDTLNIYEDCLLTWKVTNSESLVLTDTLAEVLGLIISDWITLIDAQTNNWNGQEIVPDTLNLFDVSIGAKAYADTVEESLVVTDGALYKLTVTVLEYLGFTDLANAIKTMAMSISESVGLSDTPSHALSFVVSDALASVDSLSVVKSLAGAVQESLGLTETLSFIKRLGLTVDDPLTLSETVTSQGALYSAVYDTLAMNITVELNGETYECYVLNTPKFMPSMYSGFDFNSYCVFEDRAFGANDTGIYELTGTTDAGSVIHTGAVLSDTDFGSRNNKRFRKGYLAVSGDSPLMILETEDGGRQAYTVDTGGMTVFSHDQKSKKWKISIADFDTLESIKIIPVVLSK